MADAPRLPTPDDVTREAARQQAEAGKARAERIKAIGGVLVVLGIAEAVVLQTLAIAALIRGLRRPR